MNITKKVSRGKLSKMQSQSRLKKLGNWLLIIGLTGLIALIVRTWLVVPATVAGPSMRPTLKSGDYLLLKKFGQVHRFDIVVFKVAGTTYVKRVIGLPGETVSYRHDQLYIDGRAVAEPFLNRVKHQKTVLTSDFDLATLTDSKVVPANHYFVLGDNRRISKDSRTFGPISQTTMIGRASMVYYPITHLKLLP